MSSRPSLLLGVVVLVGVLVWGLAAERPLIGQGPARPPQSEGRYQLRTIVANPGFVVVCDTATGRCWTRDLVARSGWTDLGVPPQHDK